MIFFAIIDKILSEVFILDIINTELNQFNATLKAELFTQNNQLSEKISDFVFSKSKLLRPKLIFLLSKALNKNISESIINLACATELIHCATLIHDDIVDNSELRRGKKTINYEFGNNLSVLSGDLLLSYAIQFLSKCENINCFKLFANSIKLMCEGEINQLFENNKIPTLQTYIKKSENKTAELFKASLLSLNEITNINQQQNINDFATNFGIAFQIKDDLLNITQNDNLKPSFSDIENGIYTAPIIYLQEINSNIENLSVEEIKNLIIENPQVIDKTKQLIENYKQKAISSIDFVENNQYKQEIIKIINLL